MDFYGFLMLIISYDFSEFPVGDHKMTPYFPSEYLLSFKRVRIRSPDGVLAD